MTIGLVGRKCGMTRVYSKDGKMLPVTVIAVEPNKVTQVKTKENDGYDAIQVTTGVRKASRVTKPLKGHFAKASVEAGMGLWEFLVNASDKADAFTLGTELTVQMLESAKLVDVSGVTLGKGFAGTVKRHHFAMQDATHGNSRSHRVPGSIGQRQTPGRVMKGKRMSGHMGNVNQTTQNLEVVRVDAEKNYILVKGAVPGAKGGIVIVKPAVKEKKTSN